MDKEKEKLNEKALVKNLPLHSWLIRPCDFYKKEYDHCTSLRGRFNQYYIDGKLSDCTSWKLSGKLCDVWEDDGNEKALEDLVELEKQRYIQRMGPHKQNDIWERRKEPPEDWNPTLPESHQKRIEESTLKKLLDEKLEIPSCYMF